MFKRVISFLCACTLAAFPAASVHAQEPDPPSILSVRYFDEEEPIAGCELSLVFLGNLDSDGNIQYCEEALLQADADGVSLPETILAISDDSGLPALFQAAGKLSVSASGTTGMDGIASLTVPKTGLYLLIGSDVGEFLFQPMAVSVTEGSQSVEAKHILKGTENPSDPSATTDPAHTDKNSGTSYENHAGNDNKNQTGFPDDDTYVGDKLPQTGMFHRQVLILAIFSIFCGILGIILVRKGGRH